MLAEESCHIRAADVGNRAIAGGFSAGVVGDAEIGTEIARVGIEAVVELDSGSVGDSIETFEYRDCRSCFDQTGIADQCP